ncbi:MAG: 1-phosphofructokinase [Clostridiales bacterium]|nr:1-phosphofructokinase [Clostridiales bacterium]
MILTVTLNPAVDKVYEVESFAVGDVFRPTSMWATPGGKGLNVSRVATILGQEVMATGFLGGANGGFIRSQLKEQGIIDAFVEIEGETRICIAINDPKGDTSTELLESGPIISPKEQEEFLDNFKTIAKRADLVTMSGSLPRGLSLDFYGKLIEVCRELGKRVLLDTSGETLVKSLEYTPFMVKPNQTELEAITGKRMERDQDILEAALEINQKGIELVCVTLGGHGSLAVTKEGNFRLQAPPIETISAVGSGDSFVAGCAVALSQGKDIEEVLKTGMACGMANTQFSTTGYVSIDLVDKFFDMVDIKKY